jgi:hypothetical protein
VKLLKIKQLSDLDALLTVLFKHCLDEVGNVLIFNRFMNNVIVKLFDRVTMERVEAFVKNIGTNT